MALESSKLVEKVYFAHDLEFVKQNIDNAQEQGIQCVLLLSPNHMEELSPFEVTNVDVKNDAVLPKLPIFHEKISIGMQRGGIWVIAPDKGLLAVTCISFLMTNISRNLSLEDALTVFQKACPSTLTAGEQEQLDVWNSMGSKIDTKHPDWASFQRTNNVSHEDLLTALLAQTSKKTTRYTDFKRSATLSDLTARKPVTDAHVTLLAKNWKAKKLQLNSLPSPSIGSWGYICKGCKKKLFSNDNVLLHGDNPITLDETKCSHLSLEPMRWMGSDLLKSSGTISCYACKTKLGEWHWKRWKGCSCEKKFKTTFAVTKSLIEYREKPPPPPTPKSPSNRKKKNLISGMFHNLNSKVMSKEVVSTGPGSKNAKGKGSYPVQFATCYEELSKRLQRYPQKNKIKIPLLDANWYPVCQVFRFVAKVRIIPHPNPEDPEEAERIIANEKNAQFSRLSCSYHACRSLAQGTSYAHLIEEYNEPPAYITDSVTEEALEDDDIEKEEDALDLLPFETPLTPIAEAYISLVLGEIPKCTLGLTPMGEKYFEKMTAKHISPENPKDTLKIIEKSGKGGFGSVFLARDSTRPKMDPNVAVKRMPHTTKKEKTSNFREIEILMNSKHPNIVSYGRSYIFRDEMWVVMEFMEGGSLKEAGDSHTFQEGQIAYVAKSVLLALKFLHEHGILHRDLKPGNIMLTVTGDVKLIDFGLCEEIERVVRSPRMVGSPYWMPPEIILKAPYNEKVDVWSLGVTLLQLIDRRGFEIGNSFTALFKTSVNGRPDPFSSDSYSNLLRSFIRFMLIKDVKERPSVDEVLKHPFLEVADTKKAMKRIISQIFLSNIVGMAGI